MDAPRHGTVIDAFESLIKVDPTRPLYTLYDDAVGERTELSGRSLANWVNKTANLLVDGCGLGVGDVAAVRLPAHWQTAAVLLGCWSAGLLVDLGRLPAGSTEAGVRSGWPSSPIRSYPASGWRRSPPPRSSLWRWRRWRRHSGPRRRRARSTMSWRSARTATTSARSPGAAQRHGPRGRRHPRRSGLLGHRGCRGEISDRGEKWPLQGPKSSTIRGCGHANGTPQDRRRVACVDRR